MKKLLGLLASLVLVGACSSPQTNRDGGVASTNKAVETKPTASVSQAEMEVREKATWEALEKKNYDAFADMLASDYLEVGEDGVFDKTTLVKDVKDLNTSDATFSDWKMLSINKDAVILMYNVTIKGTFKGQEIPPGPYRASSAWVKRDGKWLAVYYQQTEVNTTPHPPPPGASQPAKAAASPAAKIAEAGPDPIANEKVVWDTFKNRNYDAFATFLAPDFVEVEPDAVYDKAGSVKGVSRFDFSKAELSDWKTVKLNTDASLDSYLVKLPGEPRQRHSTIWINRDGKWMALFHQGTPETVPTAKPVAKSKP
jgi:hypothetical protein